MRAVFVARSLLVFCLLSTAISAADFQRWRDAPDRIDLSGHFFPHVEQNQTRTCFTHVLARLFEFGYNLATGRWLKISEGGLLGCADVKKAGPALEGVEREWMKGTISAGVRVLPETIMPSAKYFAPHLSFDEAHQNSRKDYLKLTEHLVTLPMNVLGEELFFAKWKVAGKMTEGNLDQVVEWLSKRRTPVFMFQVVSGLWHVVLAIGYDKATDLLLIHDSLAPSSIKGTWRGADFRQTVFGATGIYFELPSESKNATAIGEPESIIKENGRRWKRNSLGIKYYLWGQPPSSASPAWYFLGADGRWHAEG